MIKNVFFDLDGTIIDSAPGVFYGLRYCLEQNGYDAPDEAVLRKCIGPPFVYSFPNILHIPEEDVDKCIKTYRSIYKGQVMLNCNLYDGVEEALQFLQNRGYSISLCSSKPEIPCKAILEHFGIDKYFSDICGAIPAENLNTKEDVIENSFKRSPWKKKEETVLIGDTKYDAIGAANCGISCIGITYGFGTKDELLENGAIAVFDTVMEAVRYIEKH